MNAKTNNKLPVDVVNHNRWNGLTLDEIRQMRVVTLVHRELGREHLAIKMGELHHNVSNNGIRGLLFNSFQISKLKTVDYILLGWNVVKYFVKIKNRKK